MRRLTAIISLALTHACSLPASAHDDCEELGHHWDVAAYRSEMWLQLLVMGAIVALYIAGVFVYRQWKRR